MSCFSRCRRGRAAPGASDEVGEFLRRAAEEGRITYVLAAGRLASRLAELPAREARGKISLFTVVFMRDKF